MEEGRSVPVPVPVPVPMPCTERPRAVCAWPVARDIDEQTELGVLFVWSLISVQLWTALITCAGLVSVITALIAS